MSSYLDWEFMLDGNFHELRQLSTEPGTALFNIHGGVDHWLDCPNDDFRMTSLYCDGESDPNVIWQVGYELLSLFNGASALLSKDNQRMSIFKLHNSGQEIRYVQPKGSTALLGSPAVPKNRLQEDLANVKRSSIKLQLLHLATENQDVYFILKYLDMQGGWVTYYKLLEVIENFAKKEGVDLELSESQRKAFSNTANNFSLSGLDSRHGFKDLAKKNNTPTMSLSEGHTLVTNLAKRYLKLTHFK